jgi:hypothetical protein
MDVDFQKNAVKPGDENFQHDVRREFKPAAAAAEEDSWDEDGEDDEDDGVDEDRDYGDDYEDDFSDFAESF